jgi:hypothetical protein
MPIAKTPQIKYYPVGNGDMSLITLGDRTNILVDCNITMASLGSTDKAVYDVKKDLLDSIQKRNGIPYIDVFVLTHGDQDHCRGFRDNFYCGNPKDYTKKDLDDNRIMMDTLWFSPMIAEQYTNDDEDAHQQEAERRLDLHRNKHQDKDLPGNRIKIIGYDGSKLYDDLDHLRAKPGQIVDRFNDVDQTLFSIFIHAPFKITLDSSEKDKNSASIVFQARFKEYSWSTAYSCLAFFGGDSDHTTWKQILERTQRYGNDKEHQALDWDLFLAPHHCSWSFFNETPQSENPDPQSTSLEILEKGREGCMVIASSKKIIDNDDNPPHYKAKQRYITKLDSKDNFLNTSTQPIESAPEPIIFTISANGPSRPPKGTLTGASTSAGGSGAAATIITQG